MRFSWPHFALASCLALSMPWAGAGAPPEQGDTAGAAAARHTFSIRAVDPARRADVRPVGFYHIARDGATLELECGVRDSVHFDARFRLEDLVLGHDVRWSLVDGNNRSTPLTEGQGKMAISSSSSCHLSSEYVPETPKNKSRSKRVEVICTALLRITNIRIENTGTYVCSSRLDTSLSASASASASQEAEQAGFPLSDLDLRQEGLIFVKDEENTVTLVITVIILSVVVMVVGGGACSRLAGHRFAWETLEHDDEEAFGEHEQNSLPKIGSVEDNSLWLARRASSRIMSNTSNMSGIIFQVDSESFARLKERLDNVDDGGSSSGDNSRNDTPKIRVHGKDEKEKENDDDEEEECYAGVTLNWGGDKDKEGGKVDDSVVGKVDDGNGDSGVGSADDEAARAKNEKKKKAEEEAKTSSSNSNLSKGLPSSQPQVPPPAPGSGGGGGGGARRRSSFGVLPCGIGIGPGISVGSLLADWEQEDEPAKRGPEHKKITALKTTHAKTSPGNMEPHRLQVPSSACFMLRRQSSPVVVVGSGSGSRSRSGSRSESGSGSGRAEGGGAASSAAPARASSPTGQAPGSRRGSLQQPPTGAAAVVIVEEEAGPKD